VKKTRQKRGRREGLRREVKGRQAIEEAGR
jgi:hypothetical protein